MEQLVRANAPSFVTLLISWYDTLALPRNWTYVAQFQEIPYLRKCCAHWNAESERPVSVHSRNVRPLIVSRAAKHVQVETLGF
jgi:hypothetical protein